MSQEKTQTEGKRIEKETPKDTTQKSAEDPKRGRKHYALRAKGKEGRASLAARSSEEYVDKGVSVRGVRLIEIVGGTLPNGRNGHIGGVLGLKNHSRPMRLPHTYVYTTLHI